MGGGKWEGEVGGGSGRGGIKKEGGNNNKLVYTS